MSFLTDGKLCDVIESRFVPPGKAFLYDATVGRPPVDLGTVTETAVIVSPGTPGLEQVRAAAADHNGLVRAQRLVEKLAQGVDPLPGPPDIEESMRRALRSAVEIALTSRAEGERS